MTYKTSFPSFDHELTIPADFEDVSSHGDACPSWAIGDESGSQLYVNYKNPELRELPGMSYCWVLAYPADADTYTAYEGEDLEEAIRVCRRLQEAV